MSSPTPQDDQAEILLAALRLYRQFGPDKVSMDDIAKALGRSRASIYYYFKNRDEVFRSAIDAIVQETTSYIRKELADVPTLDEQLFTFCISKLRISHEWKLMLNSMWSNMNPREQSKQTGVMEGLHQKLVYQEGVILKEIVAAAAERKEIRGVREDEIERWVFVITSGIRGIRNEIADQNLTPAVRASTRVLSDMASKWLKE